MAPCAIRNYCRASSNGNVAPWILIWRGRSQSWPDHRSGDLSNRYMSAEPTRKSTAKDGVMKALQVRIRKVARGDIDRIIDIERSWHHLSHWSVDSYYRLINEDSFTSSYIAEIEETGGRSRIVGFVIFHIAADVSEIYNIAVEHSHARSGIGHQLMSSAIHESARRKASKVLLQVRKSNNAAINFYLKFNFRTSGERKNYYSNPVEDAY